VAGAERTNPGSAAPAALSEALARVGDRWSLLLIHTLLDGPQRFNELSESLPGIAPNVLSKRLKHLEEQGIVVATPYLRRPPRFVYQLSAVGAELAGALRLLTQWGASLVPDDESLHHSACGTPLEVRWYCPTCGRLVETGEANDLRFA